MTALTFHPILFSSYNKTKKDIIDYDALALFKNFLVPLPLSYDSPYSVAARCRRLV